MSLSRKNSNSYVSLIINTVLPIIQKPQKAFTSTPRVPLHLETYFSYVSNQSLSSISSSLPSSFKPSSFSLIKSTSQVPLTNLESVYSPILVSQSPIVHNQQSIVTRARMRSLNPKPINWSLLNWTTQC